VLTELSKSLTINRVHSVDQLTSGVLRGVLQVASFDGVACRYRITVAKAKTFALSPFYLARPLTFDSYHRHRASSEAYESID
jgi:hypothetical protein